MNKKKHTNHILFLLLSFLFTISMPLTGQNCYQRLTDASGIEPNSSQLLELETAACRLIDSLPILYRDSFKVYDFGFYLHNENMVGGYPEVFQAAINEVKSQSKYYLIFGKQTDKSGGHTKFWVDINLPSQNIFYCLSQENPNFNFDLSYKYQFVTNKFREENNFIPQLYHLAEQKCMEEFAAQIGQIGRCCNQNTKICSVCLLTPQVIKNYLISKGYVATPIKILYPSAAKKDSNNRKTILPRIADLCTDITSIEIDGTICTDFPTVISHIMEAYPDDVGEAKISDDNCLCNGGSLEYFNAGPPHIGTQHIRLKIHLSKGIGLDGEDIIYSQVFAPYELGELPFNAYIPNRISESSSLTPPEHLGSLNMDYVKSTVESIFSKNGITLSSISLQKPVQPYEEYDIYNGLVWHRSNASPSAGRSSHNFSTIPNPNYFEVSGNFVEFYYFNSNFNIFSNNNHMNYAIGHHFAHELLHQMIGGALGYFGKYGLGLTLGTNAEPNIQSYYNVTKTAGHTNDQLNLLLEGSYFNSSTIINTCTFITEEQKSKLRNLSGWVGQVKYLCPNKVTPDYQQMEQISPGYKALFTYLKIMRSLKETYPDETSCEIVCGSKILVNTIKMMKLEEYDGF
jgi:hypothetical protein